MQVKSALVFALTLILSLTAYVWANRQLRDLRSPARAGVAMRSLPLPVGFYQVAAGEFSGLSADFLYLDIAASLGGRADALSTQEWDRVQKAFAVATALDVYFEPTFRAIQAYLPWTANRPQEAIALLEPVHAKRNWHWMPTFFIGFDYYFFLKDNAAASRYFQQAAERPAGPALLATLAARLEAEAGNAAAGIDFLQRMMATTDKESEKKMYQKRIAALEGVLVLEKAMARYRSEFGKNPPMLETLLLTGHLAVMPANPYYDTYFYKDGVVRFDPFPSKGAHVRKNEGQGKESQPPPLQQDTTNTP